MSTFLSTVFAGVLTDFVFVVAELFGAGFVIFVSFFWVLPAVFFVVVCLVTSFVSFDLSPVSFFSVPVPFFGVTVLGFVVSDFFLCLVIYCHSKRYIKKCN